LFRFNWKIIASNNTTKIQKWAETPWKMNLGVATGRLSPVTNKYLIVLDVDAGTHPILQELPETFRYRTGSGGWHLWFWSPVPIKNSVGAVAPKVDVRGTDGYVVIPPSRHIRGSYGQVDPKPLASLPEALISLLVSRSRSKSQVSTKSKKSKKETPATDWQTVSVPEIKERMKIALIPEGTRNVVMHRLLSSARAKGATFSELQELSRSYLSTFENPESFESEITRIIESVLKYPAYNNEHEKVNDLYLGWLKKHRGVRVGPEDAKHLKDKDEEFFLSLTATEQDKPAGVSLQQVHDSRQLFLDKANVRWISCYKAQLLAKKLLSLGFQRRRTAKGNLWLVNLPVS
jgi:hypothetical protein